MKKSPHHHTLYFKQRATKIAQSCMHKFIQNIDLSSSFYGEGIIQGGRKEKGTVK